MLKVIGFVCSFLALMIFIVDIHNVLISTYFTFTSLTSLFVYSKIYFPTLYFNEFSNLQNNFFTNFPLSLFFAIISIICYSYRYRKYKKFLGIQSY